MLKSILNLKGAQSLSKSDQKTINGGSGRSNCTSLDQCELSCSGVCTVQAPFSNEWSIGPQCYKCVVIGVDHQ